MRSWVVWGFADLSGKLERAGQFIYDFDKNGSTLRPDNHLLGPCDPRSTSRYAAALRSFCRIYVKKKVSIEEQLKELDRLKKAAAVRPTLSSEVRHSP